MTPRQAFVVWLTGLPSSGKSSIAELLVSQLKSARCSCEWLDGDAVRAMLDNTAFDLKDRDKHIRVMGFFASRLEQHDVAVVASFVSPQASSRNFVRALCRNFIEVYLCTPLEVCETRDPKGLYRKARAGEISDFTGVNSPYEPPSSAEIVIDTSASSVASGVATVLKYLRERGLVDKDT